MFNKREHTLAKEQTNKIGTLLLIASKGFKPFRRPELDFELTKNPSENAKFKIEQGNIVLGQQQPKNVGTSGVKAVHHVKSDVKKVLSNRPSIEKKKIQVKKKSFRERFDNICDNLLEKAEEYVNERWGKKEETHVPVNTEEIFEEFDTLITTEPSEARALLNDHFDIMILELAEANNGGVEVDALSLNEASQLHQNIMNSIYSEKKEESADTLISFGRRAVEKIFQSGEIHFTSPHLAAFAQYAGLLFTYSEKSSDAFVDAVMQNCLSTLAVIDKGLSKGLRAKLQVDSLPQSLKLGDFFLEISRKASQTYFEKAREGLDALLSASIDKQEIYEAIHKFHFRLANAEMKRLSYQSNSGEVNRFFGKIVRVTIDELMRLWSLPAQAENSRKEMLKKELQNFVTDSTTAAPFRFPEDAWKRREAFKTVLCHLMTETVRTESDFKGRLKILQECRELVKRTRSRSEKKGLFNITLRFADGIDRTSIEKDFITYFALAQDNNDNGQESIQFFNEAFMRRFNAIAEKLGCEQTHNFLMKYLHTRKISKRDEFYLAARNLCNLSQSIFDDIRGMGRLNMITPQHYPHLYAFSIYSAAPVGIPTHRIDDDLGMKKKHCFEAATNYLKLLGIRQADVLSLSKHSRKLPKSIERIEKGSLLFDIPFQAEQLITIFDKEAVKSLIPLEIIIKDKDALKGLVSRIADRYSRLMMFEKAYEHCSLEVSSETASALDCFYAKVV